MLLYHVYNMILKYFLDQIKKHDVKLFLMMNVMHYHLLLNDKQHGLPINSNDVLYKNHQQNINFVPKFNENRIQFLKQNLFVYLLLKKYHFVCWL